MSPSYVITFANAAFCSHGGKATPYPPMGKILVEGMGVVTLSHQYAIVGCGFPAATSGAQPACVTGTFFNGTTRVLTNGVPLAVLPLSVGTSKGLPNPTPLILPPAGQHRVLAQ